MKTEHCLLQKPLKEKTLYEEAVFCANPIKVDWSRLRDSCGIRGKGKTPQAFTLRRLTTHPAESEYCSGNQPERLIVKSNIVYKHSHTKMTRNLNFFLC